MSSSAGRLPGALAALAACGLLSACGSSGGHHAGGDPLLRQSVPAHVTITTARLAGLGAVLTDAEGHVLYMFPPDAGSRVSCTGACAGTWPPLAIRDGNTPSAGRGINHEVLATLHDPNTGARIVTYSGYPLYRYAGDVAPHTANGQALFNDGGPWYVLSPSGNPITTDPGHGG